MEKFEVHGLAHITGGAFYEKLTKIVPLGFCFSIDRKSWAVPQIFQLIQKKGTIADRDMFTTFNMGIGMVLIVPRKNAQAVVKFIRGQSVLAWNIGEVRNGKNKLELK